MDDFVRICGIVAFCIVGSAFLSSGCAVSKTTTKQRTVTQGLRTPDGTLMFPYQENKFVETVVADTKPGLLQCQVDGSGKVTECTNYRIAYRLFQDWNNRSGRALYVYEDPEDPSPETRGVIECSADFPLENCQQRNLTTNLEAGPGDRVTFTYEYLLTDDEEKSDSSGFFSQSSGRKQVNPESDAKVFYPEKSGVMQCKATSDGLLERCKKLDVEFESDKKTDEEG